MWSQGDYAAVALLLEPCAVKLVDLCHIESGMTVAYDLTPRMIELGRARSASSHSISPDGFEAPDRR
jgi:hypothetical protein